MNQAFTGTDTIRNDINYGKLSVFQIDGVKFVGRSDEGERVGGTWVTDEIPEFNYIWSIRISYGATREIWVYPLDKKDILSIGGALSREHSAVTAVAHARVLVSWRNGIRGNIRTLSEFYTDLDQKDVDDTTL